jgi:hypothetical protein
LLRIDRVELLGDLFAERLGLIEDIFAKRLELLGDLFAERLGLIEDLFA